MIGYQTVVLDQCEVPKLNNKALPQWVTQSLDRSSIKFWWGKPGYCASCAEKRKGDPCCWIQRDAADYPEVQEVFSRLVIGQCVARIEYRDESAKDDIDRIDAIRSALTRDEFRGYCKGNALECILRDNHESGDEDIRKAIRNLEAILEASK